MRPIIGLTIGDPAGVGPEVIVKALAAVEIRAVCRPIVVGDLGSVARAIRQTGSSLTARPVESPDDAAFEPETIEVIQATADDLGDITQGQVDRRCGACAGQSVEVAVRLALGGAIDAICTAPLNKEALNLAGFHYPGHTEMLGALTNTRDYSMMLTAKKLRILHVSTHVSLAEAIRRVTSERVLRVIRLADGAARDYLGIDRPSIGVAGLNPHAGESRLFGDEDADQIAPAIAAARADGLNAIGPVPGDTLFARAAEGAFDITVAMFHDQGHVAAKMLGFDVGVNTSIGLPIIRTSVDHGTAFDIAGKNLARATSMIEAIKMAAFVASRRAQPRPEASAL